jgi:hypothetical protein
LVLAAGLAATLLLQGARGNTGGQQSSKIASALRDGPRGTWRCDLLHICVQRRPGSQEARRRDILIIGSHLPHPAAVLASIFADLLVGWWMTGDWGRLGITAARDGASHAQPFCDRSHKWPGKERQSTIAPPISDTCCCIRQAAAHQHPAWPPITRVRGAPRHRSSPPVPPSPRTPVPQTRVAACAHALNQANAVGNHRCCTGSHRRETQASTPRRDRAAVCRAKPAPPGGDLQLQRTLLPLLFQDWDRACISQHTCTAAGHCWADRPNPSILLLLLLRLPLTLSPAMCTSSCLHRARPWL